MTLTVSDPAALGFDPERLGRIAPFLKATYLDTGRMPHTALLISRHGKIAHLSLQGEARAGVPLAEDTIYRIASMTKPLTSIALMQLVEQGKIALSDPVTKFLPELAKVGVFLAGGDKVPFVTRPLARPIQVVDALRHTSGLTYGFQERNPIDAFYRREKLDDIQTPRNLDEWLAKLAEAPLLFDPGEAWNYGISTDLCAALVERVSGTPFPDYLQAHVLDPIGMIDTHFALPPDKIDRLADCHAFHPAHKMVPFEAGGPDSGWVKGSNWANGGGGLASTMADYHRFCLMLLGKGTINGNCVIGRKTLELMTANHLPGGKSLSDLSISLFSEAENAGVGFGLGFAVTMDPARTLAPGSAGDFYWGGMFSTAFFVDPVENLHMVFMTQLMPSSAYPVRREIRTMLYAALA